MTPQEADLIRFLERRGGIATDTAIQSQFHLGPGACLLLMGSLKRQQCVERDRRHYRVTTIGENELGRFERQSKYTPFEGRVKW